MGFNPIATGGKRLGHARTIITIQLHRVKVIIDLDWGGLAGSEAEVEMGKSGTGVSGQTRRGLIIGLNVPSVDSDESSGFKCVSLLHPVHC